MGFMVNVKVTLLTFPAVSITSTLTGWPSTSIDVLYFSSAKVYNLLFNFCKS